MHSASAKHGSAHPREVDDFDDRNAHDLDERRCGQTGVRCRPTVACRRQTARAHRAHSTGTQTCAARAKARSARTARERTGFAGDAATHLAHSHVVFLLPVHTSGGRGEAAAHQRAGERTRLIGTPLPLARGKRGACARRRPARQPLAAAPHPPSGSTPSTMGAPETPPRLHVGGDVMANVYRHGRVRARGTAPLSPACREDEAARVSEVYEVYAYSMHVRCMERVHVHVRCMRGACEACVCVCARARVRVRAWEGTCVLHPHTHKHARVHAHTSTRTSTHPSTHPFECLNSRLVGGWVVGGSGGSGACHIPHIPEGRVSQLRDSHRAHAFPPATAARYTFWRASAARSAVTHYPTWPSRRLDRAVVL